MARSLAPFSLVPASFVVDDVHVEGDKVTVRARAASSEVQTARAAGGHRHGCIAGIAVGSQICRQQVGKFAWR